MKRLLIWAAGLVLVAVLGVAVWMRTIDHPVETWHVDPASAARTGKDNDYLIAPPGLTAATPDGEFAWRDIDARALLFLFDSIAMNSSGTRHLVMDDEGLTITYVHASAVFAFPDYISVRAVESDQGAALIIWSRSRFGYSDLGANKARVESWLTGLGS